MSFFLITNALLSLMVAGVITYKLFVHTDRVGCLERVGMAFIGAALVLNIGPIVNKGDIFAGTQPTPFDDWGSTLLRVGLLIYFAARVSKHWRANEAMKRQADRYYGERGITP